MSTRSYFLSNFRVRDCSMSGPNFTNILNSPKRNPPRYLNKASLYETLISYSGGFSYEFLLSLSRSCPQTKKGLSFSPLFPVQILTGLGFLT